MDPDRPSPLAPEPTTAEVVRSEEELLVNRRRRPVERVRVTKRIVTETVTRTFEVRREELHVERVAFEGDVRPVRDADASADDEAFEIVLSEEQLVVGTRTVPRERVRVRKAVVTEEQAVEEDLRREEVDFQEVDATGRDVDRPGGAVDLDANRPGGAASRDVDRPGGTGGL